MEPTLKPLTAAHSKRMKKLLRKPWCFRVKHALMLATIFGLAYFISRSLL